MRRLPPRVEPSPRSFLAAGFLAGTAPGFGFAAEAPLVGGFAPEPTASAPGAAGLIPETGGFAAG